MHTTSDLFYYDLYILLLPYWTGQLFHLAPSCLSCLCSVGQLVHSWRRKKLMILSKTSSVGEMLPSSRSPPKKVNCRKHEFRESISTLCKKCRRRPGVRLVAQNPATVATMSVGGSRLRMCRRKTATNGHLQRTSHSEQTSGPSG